jgi:hypothetical protein
MGCGYGVCKGASYRCAMAAARSATRCPARGPVFDAAALVLDRFQQAPAGAGEGRRDAGAGLVRPRSVRAAAPGPARTARRIWTASGCFAYGLSGRHRQRGHRQPLRRDRRGRHQDGHAAAAAGQSCPPGGTAVRGDQQHRAGERGLRRASPPVLPQLGRAGCPRSSAWQRRPAAGVRRDVPQAVPAPAGIAPASRRGAEPVVPQYRRGRTRLRQPADTVRACVEARARCRTGC